MPKCKCYFFYFYFFDKKKITEKRKFFKKYIIRIFETEDKCIITHEMLNMRIENITGKVPFFTSKRTSNVKFF